ncbi:hypothetical protein [Altericista sp. CCNU0014]|uniref:hypothetical protein n=1 Tax=Altericista sp. CCNU0014 TaxID=3082949 RepID=UPI00384D51F6
MTDRTAFASWQAFNAKIEQVQCLCQNDTGKLALPPELFSLLDELYDEFQAQIAAGSEPFSRLGAGARHVTELHRLLRLSLTDAALCRAARSEGLQRQRRERLRERLSQLHPHATAIAAALSDL